MRLISLALAVLVLTGCGDKDAALRAQVEKAYQDQLNALRGHDFARYCHKVVTSLALPVKLAVRLKVPEQGPGGAPIGVEQAIRECTRGYERDPVVPHAIPRVAIDVTIDPPMTAVGGITRTARGVLMIGGKKQPYRAVFVRYHGDWKMVTPDEG